jgi:hypothetical protein
MDNMRMRLSYQKSKPLADGFQIIAIIIKEKDPLPNNEAKVAMYIEDLAKHIQVLLSTTKMMFEIS